MTGDKAALAWLSNGSSVCFENLKNLFDRDSSHLDEARVQISNHNINVAIEQVQEKWWEDHFGPVLKRIPQREQM